MTTATKDRETRHEGQDPPKRGKRGAMTEQDFAEHNEAADRRRAELEATGEYVDPLRPNLMDEPGYYEALAAADRTFSDELTPESAAALRAEISRVTPTLAHRVTRVMAAIDVVEKRGVNESQRYSYQRAVDVAREVRREFIKEGLVLTTDIFDTSTTVLPRDGRTPMILTEVKGRFRLTDGVETFEFGGAGMGIDTGDKGIYKAITGMLKYALRTLLLLPDERDDPEVQRADEAEPVFEPSNLDNIQQGGRQTKATSAQINAIRKYANELGLAPDALAAFITQTNGEPLDVDGLPPAEAAHKVLAWIEAQDFATAGTIVQALVKAASDEEDA